MVRDPITAAAETSVIDAAKLMSEKRISCLCITRGETLEGIVTLRDLVGKAMATGAANTTAINAVMTPDPRTLPPSSPQSPPGSILASSSSAALQRAWISIG